jgi:hypothetical protein
MSLPPPFDTFKLEKREGEYKDFNLPPDSTYPLRGVRYPVDYGEIEGYVAEDGANLDVFVGKGNTLAGFIKVARPELKHGEHKFYINVSEDEEKSILQTFKPVIMEQARFLNYEELLEAIEPFRQ